MTRMQSKNEINELLAIKSFRSILELNSYSEVADAIRNSGEYYDQYCANTESEDLPDGIVLFSTPQITDENDAHSYLQVIKLYGDRDLPFRVIGVRIWDEHEGISMPVLSDVRTLSEALDYAFAGHDLDSFNHEEIQRHLQHPQPPQNPMLQAFQAQTDAARSSSKALDARLRAPIKRADIATVMSIAKAHGLALDDLPNFDYADQMNRAFFAGKGEIHVIHTADPDESGSYGDVAVVGIKDASGELSFYDIDGTTKTLQQAVDSYVRLADERMHVDNPVTKDDGVSVLDFTEVVTRKIDGADLANAIDQELYLRGEQYSPSQSIVRRSIDAFAQQRELKYQENLDKNHDSSPTL